MRIHRGVDPRTFPSCSAEAEAGVEAAAVCVAVGNFDGVHCGHRSLIARARKAAANRGALARAGVLSFEPHPRELFQPDGAPFRLTLEPLKLRRLAALGVDDVYLLPFDRDLARLEAEAFVRDCLVGALRARHIVVGGDFRFGARRAGDLALLQRLGEELGYVVEAAPTALDADGRPFSSSAARAALRAGRTQEAARILGDWHRIEGPVVGGDKRGRTLGYPTANLTLSRALSPAHGVYATRAEILTGPHRGAYDAVSSFGVRPTFGDNAPCFETHLFDFDGDIYGADLSVALVRYLRPEERYDNVDALIAAMSKDADAARAALADPRPPWS